MIYWIGTGATALILLINFFFVQKTWTVRIILLVLGLIAVSVTSYRYYDDWEHNRPRHLSETQINHIVSTLSPFSGQLFQMITYPKCDECSGTFILLYNIFTKSTWIREGPPVGIPIGAMHSILINVNSNANDQTKRAADVLNTVLNQEGIKAEISNDTDDPNIVDIIVGLKP